MTSQIKSAIRSYRDALKRQAAMPENERWSMGAEIKRLKATAYVEIEAAAVRTGW